eukprot:CAMPEP_0196666572 /NCGR_PEP_ID=MMETSP1086-20130531/64590_1 /TAXON_ID=77921 /ORGANISM="Cyanoptyche  gloeocystis , Strain SAG4.97" /LENGTH=328 /DNA_ID=CAMNT_0042003783 /DNA_START=201 /DNA_END=1187 /DNA_ORIENTATION=-
MKIPMKVLVTGAAGQIAYSLVFMISKGELLGPDQPVILHLLDIPPMMEVLKGVVYEIEDCAFPLVRGVFATSDYKEAFYDIDIALLVGAMPRKDGMERKDLLKANMNIFQGQGMALEQYAKKSAKVLVVGNPANTNALIAMKNAPSIPRENFTCLTRLDHNRALAQIAARSHVSVQDVHNIAIFGNHSSTQYPYVDAGYVEGPKGRLSIKDAVRDLGWLEGDFIKTVQTRGSAIIKLRKLSSAASAATGICNHMRDWILGTTDDWVSMGVVSDGNMYGVPEDLVFSFPVRCSNGKWTIVDGLPMSSFAREKLDATSAELLDEKTQALS